MSGFSEDKIDFLMEMVIIRGFVIDRETAVAVLRQMQALKEALAAHEQKLAEAMSKILEMVPIARWDIGADMWEAEQRAAVLEARFKARCIQCREPQHPPHGYSKSKQLMVRHKSPRDRLHPGNRKRGDCIGQGEKS